jgi:hypothetical protein
MSSIRRLSLLFTVIVAALIPMSSWSKDDVTPYTAGGSCQAKPPNDFFCVTDAVSAPDNRSVDIVNIIFFCQGSTAATFALVDASSGNSYEYPMIASPAVPSGFNSVSNNTTLIHLRPKTSYTVDFAFAAPVASISNCRFTASGEAFFFED